MINYLQLLSDGDWSERKRGFGDYWCEYFRQRVLIARQGKALRNVAQTIRHGEYFGRVTWLLLHGQAVVAHGDLDKMLTFADKITHDIP